MSMIVLGTFLVNSMPDLVLFDAGMCWSFVSQSFTRSFDMSIGELECLLRVSIANEHKVFVLSFYRGCVMEISGCLTQLI